MGLSLTLSNALSGLNVNQQALTVLSQNISNANTPGYSKQSVTQQAVYLDGQGEGVSIGDVTRKVDDYLTRAIQSQNSNQGTANVVNDYNTKIQLMLGQPGSQNSMDSYINNFFNSAQSLAQSPQNTTLQQSVVNSGVTLASQMSQTASGLQTLQFQADQDIGKAVTTVNTDLKNIYNLNATIVANSALGESVADLQDQRDSTLKDLSQYINVSTFTRDDGSVNITAGNGKSLLDDNLYQLSYVGATSANTFASGQAMSPILINQVGVDGAFRGTPVQLIPGGVPSSIVSPVTGGQLAGLLTMRDQQIPNLSSQLDQIAAKMRDQVNTIQNSGSGFPGANSYTGTRSVNAQDLSQWTGSVRVAVLDQDGEPIDSPYADETNGVPPLNLDLSTLAGGSPSTQDIINAINQYYGTPQNKVELGGLNNVQMVSATKALPATPPQYSFGFNLSNQSASASQFYVTNAVVTDNTGATVSTAALNVPAINLDATNTYITTANSSSVIVNTAGANHLVEGETVYLSAPTSPSSIGGISSSLLGGFFTVSNVTGTSFQITAQAPATQSITTGVSGQTAMPPYATVPAGQTLNTTGLGLVTASLAGNVTAPFYNVTATVATVDSSGVLQTSQITYRVNNNQGSMMGAQFAAQSATDGGTIVAPLVKHPLATATLVDAQGKELPKVNGKYVTTQQGYLKISAYNSTNTIAIDSLNSAQVGFPTANPPIAGTNQGFSQYFDLNDFFVSNSLTSTGDTVHGSALNMQVSQRLLTNPGLMALGQLTQRAQSITPGAAPNYTYELTPGNNSVIEKLSALASAIVNFPPTGGLGATAQSFSSYAATAIGTASTNAATAAANNTNAQTLLDGYTQRASSISGVNLDTELANTVIYQNAYAASARVITVTNSLFDALISSFQ